MMQRLFNFLNKEVNGLHQAAFLLAFASIGAKVLAIFRDRLLAANFGAGNELDIYYAAFRLPDFIYVGSLFFVSLTSLIPFFIEKKKKSAEGGHNFINEIFTVFLAFMVFSAGVCFFAAPFLTDLIAPGFSEESKRLLIQFTRILLLSPLFLGLSNLVSGVIQSFNRFFIYSLSGVLYNAGSILGLIILYPKFGMAGVVWGVVIGAALHFLIQVPSLVNLGYVPKISFNIRWIEVWKVIWNSFPRTLSLTLNQIVLLVLTAIASFLASGSISMFNLASNLQAIPLTVIALSYSVAAFPALARNFIEKQNGKFLSSVVASFRHILFWLLPFSALLIVLRAQVVRSVLGAGAFSWTDTRLTAAALALFSFSLFAQGLILLFSRAFYAAERNKVPLLVNLFSSVATIFFAAIFIWMLHSCVFFRSFLTGVLRVEDVSGAAFLALPLAYSLGSVLNFFLLFWAFEKEIGSISEALEGIWQIVLNAFFMACVAYLGLNIFDDFFDLDTFFGIFTQGFLSGLLAFLFGFFLLRLLKNKELNDLTISFKNRVFRKFVIKPEPEEIHE
ncbi:MAG: lipid II flippase MurJ [Candidatus Pacebacteria bacterium]|nr:lipid II flippase MurJ [Candidatus Paceibacterota bacterium]